MSTPPLALDVQQLDFSYSALNAPPKPVLKGVDLQLPPGSRCILVGSNGAGKSTLLQILAGKRLTRSHAKVLGSDVFFKTPEGVTYLGTEWAANPVVRSDLEVAHFLDSLGGYRHKERRDKLLDILDVDLSWHMHEVSDGERRRVQIVSGLMAPWDVLLLDEVTVDLDVLVRSRLLDFLITETTTRGATLLYATHIFDGLDAFPTHLCHMQLGSTLPPSPLAWPLRPGGAGRETVPQEVLGRMEDPERRGSRMLELALHWLEEDRKVRVEKEVQEGGKQRRGARKAGEGETTDSEAFYKKYDYSH
ncbi:hypothetical protein JCM10207_005430 [Rhodosporidiobolus poonsookiae]